MSKNKIMDWLRKKIPFGYDDAMEFAKQFPDSCMICSFHRYGIMHGHLKAGSLPPEHVCIEARADDGIPSCGSVPILLRFSKEVKDDDKIQARIGTDEEIDFLKGIYVHIKTDDGWVWAEGYYVGYMMEAGGVLMKMLEISKKTGKKVVAVLTQEQP